MIEFIFIISFIVGLLFGIYQEFKSQHSRLSNNDNTFWND